MNIYEAAKAGQKIRIKSWPKGVYLVERMPDSAVFMIRNDYGSLPGSFEWRPRWSHLTSDDWEVLE